MTRQKPSGSHATFAIFSTFTYTKNYVMYGLVPSRTREFQVKFFHTTYITQMHANVVIPTGANPTIFEFRATTPAL
jgi:hypothetical protein